MVPSTDVLPEVLPTDRLGPTGKALPPIREELRRIPVARNVAAVVSVYAQSVGLIVLAAWIANPFVYLLAFVWMGRTMAAFASLSHEAAHRLLFPNKRVNDWVGRWIVGLPGVDLHRHLPAGPHRPPQGGVRAQRARHEPLRGLPDQPGVAAPQAHPRRGRHLRVEEPPQHHPRRPPPGLRHPRPPDPRRAARPAAVATAFGRPELYVFLWFVPWMTSWRVINRLRAIAEHGGMEQSKDRRRTTHSVRQHPVARFFMVPYNIGWHLAHHVDMGVPWRNLPRMHEELRAGGYVPDELEHPSYLALWRRPRLRRGAPPGRRRRLIRRPVTDGVPATVRDGAVAEWTIAPVLKTGGPRGPGGSNPPRSAPPGDEVGRSTAPWRSTRLPRRNTATTRSSVPCHLSSASPWRSR